MNALRHVTYRNREPWIPEDDLVLTKTLAGRIKYVRKNLLDKQGKSLTQPAFADALGIAGGHHGVVAWEIRGREPKPETREKLAALTKNAYRPEVFSRAGAEEIVVASAAPRLRGLEVVESWATRQILRLAETVALELDPMPAREDAQSDLRSDDAPL